MQVISVEAMSDLEYKGIGKDKREATRAMKMGWG